MRKHHNFQKLQFKFSWCVTDLPPIMLNYSEKHAIKTMIFLMMIAKENEFYFQLISAL